MPGKCLFNPAWLEKDEYKEWLQPYKKNVRKGWCCWCSSEVDVANMGESALKKHMERAKHNKFLKGRKTAVDKMNNFFIKPVAVTAVHSSSTDAALQESSKMNKPDAVTDAHSSSSTDAALQKSNTLDKTVGSSKDVLDAEILWCLKVVTSHYSYKSSNDSGNFFSLMFPDSLIAQRFSCSERKIAYFCHFGLMPYFQSIMYDAFKRISHFTLLFDETLNRSNQKKQLDLHIRYWQADENKVATRYLTSVFMGHATAANIFESFIEAVKKLDLKKLLQISMDGPAVNWSFYETLQKELKKEYNIECLSVGSCGLHILNNAFRKGATATGWDIASILGAVYYLFKDSPARREDFLSTCEHKKLPLKFCNHRWLENAPVCQRVYEIWQDLKTYVKLVDSKKYSKITSKSFETLRDALNDKTMPIKFLFFICVSELVKPFLEHYQSDAPLVPFLASDVHKLVKQLLHHFKVLKEENANKISASLKHLCSFNFMDKETHSEISKISLGFRADKLLQELYAKKAITDKTYLTLKQEAQIFVLQLLGKLMEKCPVNYSLIRNAACMNPKHMVENTANAEIKMKNMLLYLSQKGHIFEEECDNILLEYTDFVENVAQANFLEFKNFNSIKQRLDTFLHSFIDEKYLKLWEIFKMVLILSHGQASVERGFSVNKNIEVENLSENSYMAQRVICDAVKHAGGINNVQITKEMRVTVSSAHSQYRSYLEEQKKKTVENKAESSEHISLREKKSLLEKEIKDMQKKAKELSEKAETIKDFNLLQKSNDLLKTVLEKQTLLKELDSNISEMRPLKKIKR